MSSRLVSRVSSKPTGPSLAECSFVELLVEVLGASLLCESAMGDEGERVA